jgi:hypothetical protein
MAQSATIYSFAIELAHVDRGVYETLDLRVACQPSETPEYLLSRVLAYCLEFTEGISFGKGLAEPGEPAVSVRDLTGALTVWIEVGAPDAARLHKASLAGPRVVVYTHREPRQVLAAADRVGSDAGCVEPLAVERARGVVVGDLLGEAVVFELAHGGGCQRLELLVPEPARHLRSSGR